MAQIFNIVDDTVIINKAALRYTSGNLLHAGSLQVVGNTQLDGGLSVTGSLVADTLHVKQLVTENGSLDNIGEWNYATEDELNGKGFTWSTENQTTRLIYRTGNNIWANANIDLSDSSQFKINGESVLSANALGGGVVSSNLRRVGNLENLTVSGDAQISDFAFFNSTHNRFGIGTDEPNAAISVLENNVEIAIGSPDISVATIGTYSNHNLGIITDNTTRILVKANGEVVIGDSVTKNSVLRVYGKVFAESIETDIRIDRTHSLEFRSGINTTVFGLGLTWAGNGTKKSLLLVDGPDRFVSSEDIDLAADKAYRIDGSVVLSKTDLGTSVRTSSLTKVGELESLSVAGGAMFKSSVTAGNINANSLTLNGSAISGSGLESTNSTHIKVKNVKAFYADDVEVNVGDSTRQDKPVKVFGKLSVGIKNPDPSLNFAVDGDVSIGGKKFTSGDAPPSSGSFSVGDICWNTRPQADSYVGWICVVTGDPGQWLPFGAINT